MPNFPSQAPDPVRAIIEAIPFPTFFLEEDLHVLDTNESGQRFLDADTPVELRKLCGETLHCINAMADGKGCGHTPECADCVIRGAVTDVFAGRRVERRRSTLNLVDENGTHTVHVVVTASRLVRDEERVAMLILEDITEWIELEGIVPICAQCKKIRSDPEFWEQVESYFAKRTRLEFSHGLCPGCAGAFMEEHNLQREPDD